MEEESDPIRVQEFVAHSTQVNCVAIGPKSNQVLATGGEDTKVNIWRVGSVSNIWTLSNNKAPIECLCFDSEENCVVSGSLNGSIKVYDLNEGKLARNLGSHNTNVTSVQYHPYGEFLVTGSVDCTMKFWDVRNKACVETYTGHKKEITSVRFSPDGKWVASASKDGTILFYDLIASKHIDTIKLAPAYVTNFEFNPCEFSLAAITSARTVRLWDLESMKPISYTPPESSPVRAITYSNLGNQLFSTAKSSLKIWDIEQELKLSHNIDIGWDAVNEMRVANNDQLIAACCVSNFVSVWEIDLSHYVNNDELNDEDDKSQEEVDLPVVSRGGGGPSMMFSPPSAKEIPQDKQSFVAPAAYSLDPPNISRKISGQKEIFSPPSMGAEQKSYDDYPDDFEYPAESKGGNGSRYEEDDEKCRPEVVPGEGHMAVNMAASMGESFWNKFKKDNVDNNNNNNNQPMIKMKGNDQEIIDIPIQELQDMLPPSSFDNKPPSMVNPSSNNTRMNNISSPSHNNRYRMNNNNNNNHNNNVNIVIKEPPKSVERPSSRPLPLDFNNNNNDLDIVGMKYMKNNELTPPINNNLQSPPPKTPSTSSNETNKTHDLLDKLLFSSTTFTSQLSQRLGTIKLLHSLWKKGDVLPVLDHLDTLIDSMTITLTPYNLIIVSDFFLTIELKNHQLSLDACCKILPILLQLIYQYQLIPMSQNEMIILSAYKGCNQLLLGFGELIRNTRSTMIAGGVDISRETRLNKCNVCYELFMKAKQCIDNIKRMYKQHILIQEQLDHFIKSFQHYF